MRRTSPRSARWPRGLWLRWRIASTGCCRESGTRRGPTPKSRSATATRPRSSISRDGPTADPQETVSLAAKPANPEAASARNDGRALAQADRLVRIATWIEDFLGLPSRIEPDAQPGADGRAIAAAVGDRGESAGGPRGPVTAGLDSSRRSTRESLMLGDLRAPLGLIVAAAVAYRLRRPIEKWWRRKAPTSAGVLGRPHLHRPHRPGSPFPTHPRGDDLPTADAAHPLLRASSGPLPTLSRPEPPPGPSSTNASRRVRQRARTRPTAAPSTTAASPAATLPTR